MQYRDIIVRDVGMLVILKALVWLESPQQWVCLKQKGKQKGLGLQSSSKMRRMFPSLRWISQWY